jgi:hypothetical protein
LVRAESWDAAGCRSENLVGDDNGPDFGQRTIGTGPSGLLQRLRILGVERRGLRQLCREPGSTGTSGRSASANCGLRANTR